jgi:hypothetical protein
MICVSLAEMAPQDRIKAWEGIAFANTIEGISQGATHTDASL